MSVGGGDPGQAQSMQIAGPPAVEASQLRGWTRKQELAGELTCCLGITDMVSSSPDRFGAGQFEAPSAVSASSRSAFGVCASFRAV